jgi:Tol biopolymer transport system component
VSDHRWSKDGKRVAYRARRAIWVADADGSKPRRLVGDSERGLIGADAPNWSPDERTVYFDCSTFSPDRARICAVPATGGSYKVIATVGRPPAVFRALDVSSRAGMFVAVREVSMRETSNRYDVLTMRLDGTDVRALTKLVAKEKRSVSWSPDGQTIAFTDGNGLRMMNADGTGKRTVMRFTRRGRPFRVTWSPTGALLAYQAGQSIWIVKPDGTDPRRVALEPNAAGLAWRRV